MQFSVILPAKNEAEGLRLALPGVRLALPDAQIIVVDDGSTDDTADVACNLLWVEADVAGTLVSVRPRSSSKCPMSAGGARAEARSVGFSSARAAKSESLLFSTLPKLTFWLLVRAQSRRTRMIELAIQPGALYYCPMILI